MYEVRRLSFKLCLNDSGDGYDYDKGYGYTAPEEGQSFSDYVKEQDPDLYNSLFEWFSDKIRAEGDAAAEDNVEEGFK